jgi:hypothetical protein
MEECYLQLLDYVVRPMLSFVRNCQTVFRSGCTILHCHKQLWVSVATCLSSVWCCQILDFSYSDRRAGASHYCLSLHFPWWHMMLESVCMLIFYLCYLLWWGIYSDLYSIFKMGCFISNWLGKSFFICIWTPALY